MPDSLASSSSLPVIDDVHQEDDPASSVDLEDQPNLDLTTVAEAAAANLTLA